MLGRGRVAIGILEPGQVEDVTSDFLGRLGLSRDGFVFRDERTNDSLPVHLLEIARSLELFDMRPGQRMRVLNALRAGLADKATAARTVYSPGERTGILARFAESNRRLAREAFRPRGAVSRAAAGARRRLLSLSRPAARDPAQRLDRAGRPRTPEPALTAGRVALANHIW